MRSQLNAFFIGALVGLLASGAAAQTDKETQALNKLASVRAELKELATQQREIEAQRNEASKVLREADQKVSAASKSLRQTEISIAHQETELQRLRGEAEQMQKNLAAQREQLAALVRSAYALGRHEQLKLLLAQDQMRDLTRVLVYHRYIQNMRADRAAQLVKSLEGLANLMRDIEQRSQTLVQARDTQQSHLQSLESQRAQRSELISELNKRFRSDADRIAALGRDEQALVKLIAQLQDVLSDVPAQPEDARPFATRKGRWVKPLSGSVLAAYGGRLPDGRRSEGQLIAGTEGASVRAVAPGRVAFADWLNGYGLIIILDHGDGWMSLYASNDALLREAGEWVQTGEPVAHVGGSGGQGRAALYFELRQKGRPVDPASWWLRR